MFVLEKIKEYAKTDKVALMNHGAEETLTYKEMDEYSDGFAAYLLSQFGDSKVPVVIYGHKELFFLPCMYGALKAGRAYVPVDITIPKDRVADIIAEVKPQVFVCLQEIEVEEVYGAKVLTLSDLQELMETYRGREVAKTSWVQGDDDCYILFTSGSTGKPKGVPINKKNIENLAWQITPWCDMGEDKPMFLNQISYSFDVSVISVYIGISLGKTLYTIDKYMMEKLPEMYRRLEESGLSFWVSTPSFAEICIASDNFNRSMLPNLQSMLFCGETLTHKLVATLWERFPGLKIVNTYGQTEATVLVTAVEITGAMEADERPIPIGAPLEEVRFEIVDDKGNVLPEGETGELLIISDNVSKGYYHRPDLTKEKFFFKEYADGVKPGYRTGDAAYRKDGQYYFCGRIDFQIKLNGYRIELEDIENNLLRVNHIIRAVVLPVSKEEKIDHLVAFVLMDHKSGLSGLKLSMAIKEELKQYLPSYMVPRKIIVKESFPVNTNGKVDRKALMAEQREK